METPGNGPPAPVILPLIVHAAAAGLPTVASAEAGLPAVASAEAGGACCAPSAVLAITMAIAAPLTVVDILISCLDASFRAAYAFRNPATKTKQCLGPDCAFFYFLYLG